MGGAGCRHAVRDRVAVRVCSLYDRRIAVSFAVRTAENRGTRAAELTAAPDEKRYIRGKRCHAWQRFFSGAFAVTREIPPRDISHHMKNGYCIAAVPVFHKRCISNYRVFYVMFCCTSSIKIEDSPSNFLPSRRKLLSLHFLRSYASSGSSCDYDRFF